MELESGAVPELAEGIMQLSFSRLNLLFTTLSTRCNPKPYRRTPAALVGVPLAVSYIG